MKENKYIMIEDKEKFNWDLFLNLLCCFYALAFLVIALFNPLITLRERILIPTIGIVIGLIFALGSPKEQSEKREIILKER